MEESLIEISSIVLGCLMDLYNAIVCFCAASLFLYFVLKLMKITGG